jgi:hypothetical protein
MRIIIAAAIVLSLAGAAYAQAPAINLLAPEKKKDPLKEMKDEEIDRAYRETTQGGKGGANSPNDPWAAVRAAEQPAKSAAKPAPKPKTAARTEPSPAPQAQPRVQAQPRPQAQPQAQAPQQPQSVWPAAPGAVRPQSQAQSEPASNSPWPPTPR